GIGGGYRPVDRNRLPVPALDNRRWIATRMDDVEGGAILVEERHQYGIHPERAETLLNCRLRDLRRGGCRGERGRDLGQAFGATLRRAGNLAGTLLGGKQPRAFQCLGAEAPEGVGEDPFRGCEIM